MTLYIRNHGRRHAAARSVVPAPQPSPVPPPPSGDLSWNIADVPPPPALATDALRFGGGGAPLPKPNANGRIDIYANGKDVLVESRPGEPYKNICIRVHDPRHCIFRGVHIIIDDPYFSYPRMNRDETHANIEYYLSNPPQGVPAYPGMTGIVKGQPARGKTGVLGQWDPYSWGDINASRHKERYINNPYIVFYQDTPLDIENYKFNQDLVWVRFTQGVTKTIRYEGCCFDVKNDIGWQMDLIGAWTKGGSSLPNDGVDLQIINSFVGTNGSTSSADDCDSEYIGRTHHSDTAQIYWKKSVTLANSRLLTNNQGVFMPRQFGSPAMRLRFLRALIGSTDYASSALLWLSDHKDARDLHAIERWDDFTIESNRRKKGGDQTVLIWPDVVWAPGSNNPPHGTYTLQAKHEAGNGKVVYRAPSDHSHFKSHTGVNYVSPWS